MSIATPTTVQAQEAQSPPPLPARSPEVQAEDRRNLWITFGIVVAVMLAALPVLTYPLGRDQGEFAVMGRGLLWGDVPYVDLWNPKPPAVFAVYAAFIQVFGRSTEAIRLIDFAIFPPIALSLYVIAEGLSRRAAVGHWATLLFGVFYFSETFWTLTQNDGIAIVPMAWAAATMLIGVQSASLRRQIALTLIAGLLCGLAFWFKYPFALFAAALAVWMLYHLRADRRAALFNLIGFGIGFAAVVSIGVAWLAGVGAFGAWLESIRVTGSYTALGFDPTVFIETMRTATADRWAQAGLVIALAVPGVFVLKKRGLPLAWLLSTTAIMLVQAKGYDYHWLPMLPPLVLFAAAGLDRITSRPSLFGGERQGKQPTLLPLSPLRLQRRQQLRCVRGWGVRWITALALLAILAANTWPRAWAYLIGQEDRVAYDHRFIAGEFDAGESREVANTLRERVAPTDSLTIWGFRPEIYYLADLNPATRFYMNFPLVGEWYPAEWREEHADLLWAAMPPYALVLQADWMPWVTGMDADSNTLLQGYSQLNNWLIANYNRETQIGNFFLWKRNEVQ